jgi:hypothetical protein
MRFVDLDNLTWQLFLIRDGVQLLLALFFGHALALQTDNPRLALNQNPLFRSHLVRILFVVNFRDGGAGSLKRILHVRAFLVRHVQ